MTTADPLELVRVANPIPVVALDPFAAAHAEQLLVQLRAGMIEPPILSDVLGHRNLRRRPLLAAALATAALATGAGVAVADDAIPFSTIAAFVGIGTADHAQATTDVLDPAIISHLESDNARAGGLSPGTIIPHSSRLVGQLPSGRSIYVLATSKGELGVVVVDQNGKLELDSYGNPLSQTEPLTGVTFDPDGPSGPIPPLSYGIAKDGITAVSFTADGTQQTVPVVNNVWAYEGTNGSLESFTLHYADGTTQTITH
jgi:hypothetical protein